jgi:hypothetical protein
MSDSVWFDNVFGWGEGFYGQRMGPGQMLLDVTSLRAANLLPEDRDYCDDETLWLEIPVPQYAKEHVVNAGLVPPDFALSHLLFQNMETGVVVQQLPPLDPSKLQLFRLYVVQIVPVDHVESATANEFVRAILFPESRVSY